jgi:hypothetical protein
MSSAWFTKVRPAMVPAKVEWICAACHEVLPPEVRVAYRPFCKKKRKSSSIRLVATGWNVDSTRRRHK